MPRKNKTTDTAAAPRKAANVVSVGLGPSTQEKIKSWEDAKATGKVWNEKENKLRVELAEMFCPAAKRTEGTNRVDGPGFEVKVDHKLNRTLDAASLPAVLSGLPYEVTVGLIEYKPTLNVEKYRALSPEHRNFFDQCLTIKDGTPTLEIHFKEDGVSAPEGSGLEHTPPEILPKRSGRPPLPVNPSIAAPAAAPVPVKTIAPSPAAQPAPKAKNKSARKTSVGSKVARASNKPTAKKPVKSPSKSKTKSKK